MLRACVSNPCRRLVRASLQARSSRVLDNNSPQDARLQRRTISSTVPLLRQATRTTSYNSALEIKGFWDKEIYVQDFIEIFRDLQILSKLGKGPESKNANDDMTRELKYAERALFPLLPESNPADCKVKMSMVKELIPEEQGRAWAVFVEYMKTGKIQRLAVLDEEWKAAMSFCRIYDVGPKKAWPFVRKGCRTFKDLEDSGLLTKAQKLGLKYLNDTEKLIPRKESEAFRDAFNKALTETDGSTPLQGELLGSFARGAPWSSDVDYIVHSEKYFEKDAEIGKAILVDITERLIAQGLLIPEQLKFGSEKWQGYGKLPGSNIARRVDIRIMPMAHYPYMKLRSCGDTEFLKAIQDIARWQGLLLNEYGLGKRLKGEDRNMQKGSDTYHPDHMIYLKTEEEIFERLSIPYIPPEERNFKSGRIITKHFKNIWREPLAD